jgi:hypothetical protein
MKQFGFLIRHEISSIFILLYYVLWLCVLQFFHSGAAAYPNSCGAANGALILLFLFVTLVYTLILLIKILLTEEEKRRDYLKLLLILWLPICFTLIALLALA